MAKVEANPTHMFLMKNLTRDGVDGLDQLTPSKKSTKTKILEATITTFACSQDGKVSKTDFITLMPKLIPMTMNIYLWNARSFQLPS